MTHIVLDPSLLAAPPADSSREALEEYLTRLLELEELEASGAVALTVSAQSIEALAKADAYPLVDRYSKEQFPQRTDVLRLVYGMVDRLPFIEDLIGIRDALVDEFTCEPEVGTRECHPALREHFLYLCACIAISQAAGDSKLLSVMLGSSCSGCVECRVHGTLADLEREDLQEGSSALLFVPLSFDYPLLVAESVRDLMGCASLPICLWLDGHLYESGLRLALHQRSCRGEPWPLREHRWKVGEGFVATVDRHGFGHERPKAGALLRACTEVVLDPETPKSHPLRKNRSGGSGDIVRSEDGARALRHDIGYEYHLHYWATSSGPEFAAVVVHNNFDIPA